MVLSLPLVALPAAASTPAAQDDGAGSAALSLVRDPSNVNRAPILDNPGPLRASPSTPIMLALVAADPDGDDITWSATDLPSGLAIDAGSGVVFGTVSATASVSSPFHVTVRATDDGSPNLFAEAAFTWTIAVADVAPVGMRSRTAVGSTAVSLDMPDDPITGPAVQEPLGSRLAVGVLAINSDPPRSKSLTELGHLDPSATTEVLVGTVFQSLYILRVPLALLGGAIFWSLIFGGLINLGLVFRGGIPRFVKRTSRVVAVALVPHGGRVDILAGPGGGSVVGRLPATDRALEAGRRVEVDGREWVEVTFDGRRGWVRGFNLTEEVDRSWFADDPMPPSVVREFIARLRARQDFSDLVSTHGLFVSHHAPLVHFAVDVLPAVMESSVEYVWKGRNPAYPDYAATFDLAVATSVLDAFDHPYRELLADVTAVPSTVIPVEFSNFHFIAIGADVHGAERLDQSAWLVVFSYEASRPRIIGLVKEG